MSSSPSSSSSPIPSTGKLQNYHTLSSPQTPAGAAATKTLSNSGERRIRPVNKKSIWVGVGVGVGLNAYLIYGFSELPDVVLDSLCDGAECEAEKPKTKRKLHDFDKVIDTAILVDDGYGLDPKLNSREQATHALFRLDKEWPYEHATESINWTTFDEPPTG